MDEDVLRKKVRAAMQGGELPARLPDELFGGPATGARCAVCGKCMHDGIELELVFTGTAGGARETHFVHPRCLSIFEREIETLPGRVVHDPRQAANS